MTTIEKQISTVIDNLGQGEVGSFARLSGVMNLLAQSPGGTSALEERFEQILKHGFDVTSDKGYVNGELIQAADFALNPSSGRWPDGWGEYFKDKIIQKTQLERLAVAAAFIMAEYDRIYKIQNP